MFGIFKRKTDPRSLGFWCIKASEKSTLCKDSPLPLSTMIQVISGRELWSRWSRTNAPYAVVLQQNFPESLNLPFNGVLTLVLFYVLQNGRYAFWRKSFHKAISKWVGFLIHSVCKLFRSLCVSFRVDIQDHVKSDGKKQQLMFMPVYVLKYTNMILLLCASY